MNKAEIQEALKIIREPITVHQENYKYFDEENYNKLVRVYENCQWFINNWEQFQQNIEDLQKKAELGEHYKHLYSEVKKQKDDVVKLIYKKMRDVDIYGTQTFDLEELLRMLGEIDE